jgi:anti-sigma regulatory factor (Ser/Thr protein kinase)
VPLRPSSLPASVVEHALGNHPAVRERGAVHTEDAPGAHGAHEAGFTDLLAPAPMSREEMAFDIGTIMALRRFVTTAAVARGVDTGRIGELTVSASEIATNAIVHGQGGGRVRIWTDDDHLVCEITGTGQITDPLVGRIRPIAGQRHGYGVWLANQFCDLVQIRSAARGTTVRLHVSRA